MSMKNSGNRRKRHRSQKSKFQKRIRHTQRVGTYENEYRQKKHPATSLPSSQDSINAIISKYRKSVFFGNVSHPLESTCRSRWNLHVNNQNLTLTALLVSWIKSMNSIRISNVCSIYSLAYLFSI